MLMRRYLNANNLMSGGRKETQSTDAIGTLHKVSHDFMTLSFIKLFSIP